LQQRCNILGIAGMLQNCCNIAGMFCAVWNMFHFTFFYKVGM